MTVIRGDKGYLWPRGDAIEFHVHGVTYRNRDGTDRQRIIARLWQGEALCLLRERDNPRDHNAIVVVSRHGGVGYVPQENTAKLAARLDRGEEPNVLVQWTSVATATKPARGVGVIVDFDTPPVLRASDVPALPRRNWLERLFRL